MHTLRTALFRCLPFIAAAGVAFAGEPDPSKLHAWYRSEGLEMDGARVAAWKCDSPARALSRVVGQPLAHLVKTPGGNRAVLRLDGESALWQAAGAWGGIPGERTVIAFVRVAEKAGGFLFDGSTKSGASPARWEDGKWETTATASPGGKPGEWSVQTFTFQKGGAPLGGFIVGADVAAKNGLQCDVGEVLVYDRALGDAELGEASAYLRAKWGTPTDLPAAQQPKLPGLPDDPRIFRTTIRKRGDDGVHTYRIPGLATTLRGTLIAVFDNRNHGGGDLPGDIDVGMMRSTDDGKTWGKMERIMDYDATGPGSRGNGVGDPTVLVDAKTGAIFVAALWSKGNRGWHGSGPGMTPEETGQFVICKSTDDGLTWSKPVNITAQVKQPEWRLCFQGPGSGIQLRDGTLVLPAQFKGADNVPHSCFIASIDGGATWKMSPPAIPRTPPTSEAQIVECADGSLLLSMRNEARAGKRAWARWEWKGDIHSGKWSEPWLDVTDPTCMASVIRHSSGVLVFSNPNNSHRRDHMTIRTSDDSGRTWSDGKLLDPGVSMYSSLTELRDGRIGILYESGDTAGLVFASFPLDWVREQK